MAKLVTEQDVDRVYDKHLHINEDLKEKLLEEQGNLDEQRKILYDVVVVGYDVSFALSYDWVVEYLVNKILGATKKDEKDRDEVKPKRFRKPKKIKWGTYKRTPQIFYSKREMILLNRLITEDYKTKVVWDIYNKTYDKRTRTAIYNKVGRLKRGHK